MADQDPRSIKVMVVGDAGCGKTCLLTSFCRGFFPTQFIPTVFESWADEYEVDGQVVLLCPWDSAGQSEYDRLRPLGYPRTNVFLLCYAIDSAMSLYNVQMKWIAEISHYCPAVPIILVGCKSDIRGDTAAIEALAKKSQRPVPPEAGAQVAWKIGAKLYVECSAKTKQGVHNVFQCAVREALRVPVERKKSMAFG